MHKPDVASVLWAASPHRSTGGGTVTLARFFAFYGTTRYSTGMSPTATGFTDQYGNAAPGLAFYHARYYDPAVGQLTSAYTMADGPNRYGYVARNPIIATDLSDRMLTIGDGMDGGTPTRSQCSR